MNPSPESADTLRRLLVPVEPATPESIAPFGQLLGRIAAPPSLGLDYYRGKVSTARTADYACDSRTEIALSTLQRRPLEVRYMERHPGHTQTFVPLGGKPWMAVFAPPNQADMPDLDAARAFRFDGNTGLCLHRGTWHEFPFPVEDDTDMIVLLSSQATQDLKQRTANGIEAYGPDLDKKDITLRAGVVIVLDA